MEAATLLLILKSTWKPVKSSQYMVQTVVAIAASWWNGAGSNVVSRYIYDYSGTYQETNSIASKAIPSTGWHHMVLTASKANHQMITYMDGVIIDNTALPANYDPSIATQDHTFIGSHSDYSNNWCFVGGIDEFQIFNSVLTANQIYTLYYKKSLNTLN